MPDDTNAQKIASFNQRKTVAGAAGAQSPPLSSQPAQVVTPNYKMSVADIQLLQQMQDDPSKLSNEDLLRAQALSTKDNLEKAEAARKKAERDRIEQARKEGKLRDVVQSEVQRGLRATGEKTTPAMNWIANRPTPGGIATILIIIGIFLLAIVPVDNQGNTRLKLIWLTLTGKTHIAGPAPPIISPGQQAGQSFTSSTTQQPLNTGVTPVPNLNIPNGVNLFSGLINL